MPESPYPMISIEAALAIIEREVQVLPAITLPFNEALGFVLAEDVFADEPMPPFPAASVDDFDYVNLLSKCLDLGAKYLNSWALKRSLSRDLFTPNCTSLV